MSKLKAPEIELYWNEPPPEPSKGLVKWLKKIGDGWRPNSRICGLDYYSSAEFYGVYLYEYLYVLRPLLKTVGAAPTN